MSATDINLNFINQSRDANSSSVVIFQQNVATSYSELAIAWRVIQDCGQLDNHPFTYPDVIEISSSDSWGNDCPMHLARPGQMFAMRATPSGDRLVYDRMGDDPAQVSLLNALPNGAINASVYRDGRLLATRTAIAPQQTAAFQFKPSIWIGVAPYAVEGQAMDSATLQTIDTELSLAGIASADIVMKGGGAGPGAQPYSFLLANVVVA